MLIIFKINVCTKRSIKYDEIIEKSVMCAVALKKLGVKKNDVVLIMSENCFEFLYTVLGTWYIGAVVNPINPMYNVREYNIFLNTRLKTL